MDNEAQEGSTHSWTTRRAEKKSRMQPESELSIELCFWPL